MERSETCEILEALAGGANPITGQPLPEASPYHHPHVLRALNSALLVMRRSKSPVREGRSPRGGAGRAGPANAYLPWNLMEESRLAAAHDSGRSIEELAEEHQRTPRAIQSRLIRLGRLAPPEYARS